jgi:hypothetical protein
MSRLVYVCDEAARCAMGIIKGGDGSFRNIKQHHEHPRRTSVGLALALVCSVYFPRCHVSAPDSPVLYDCLPACACII